jgi:hypothetical protein
MYQNALLRIPITHKFGIDAIEIKSMYAGMRVKQIIIFEPQILLEFIFHAFGKGAFEDGYYIDPISMLLQMFQSN